MKHRIIGTAGHIDHGKSCLVHALTGSNTDRLPEEKRRGITIELGFTSLTAEDVQIGVVDVPGHEGLIRTMVAGASGIDFVMVVIAADEGIMPQTREHLAICDFLGIHQGLIVLSKIDLVDADWLELVRTDLRNELQNTSLKRAPILEVSAVTGQGIDHLRDTIFAIARDLPDTPHQQPARLPIDRAFELHGLGPVVTGSLHGSDLRVGETVAILPSAQQGRIRGLQVHHQSVQQAHHGQRTAVNLQGIPLEALARGQILTHDLSLQTSREIAVSLRSLPHLPKPIKHRAPLLCHIGTQQIACRVWLPNAPHIEPGQHAFAHLLLDEPALVLPNDHLILRGFERFPKHGSTVAGGLVLDPFPPRRKRRRTEQTERLDTLLHASPEQRAALLVQEARHHAIAKPALAQRLGVFGEPLDQLLQRLLQQDILHQLDHDPPLFLHASVLQERCDLALQRLHQHHQEHPLHEGMPREALREQLQIPSPRLFQLVLQTLLQHGKIAPPQDLLRLSTHHPQRNQEHVALEQRLLSVYHDARLSPPRVQDLPPLLHATPPQLKPILTALLRNNRLIRVSEELYFHPEPLHELQQRLIAFLLQHKTLSPQDFKELTQASRKFSIPLAEYFDKQRITHRQGDQRILRDPNAYKGQS